MPSWVLPVVAGYALLITLMVVAVWRHGQVKASRTRWVNGPGESNDR